MLPQIADFRAEADELRTLLATLHEDDWDRTTQFKAWTINDVVQHLHASDLIGAAAAAGRESFAEARREIEALRNRGMSRLEETRYRLGHLKGLRLLKTWRTQVISLCDTLATLPPDTRLPWWGPDMGVRMFATARQMETWAHGQEIFDLMGIGPQPTDRLRNIAELGVRTFGWTFANRGLPKPEPMPYVRLTAPSGDLWEWNAPSAGNKVEGMAVDFCQVVTQARNVADTELSVVGEPARAWMRIAQCFAGPPEDPPAPGTRFRVTS